MPIAIISLILQIALIIHVVRTGRDMRWIFLLLFLPGIGSLVYLFIEVLPSLRGNLGARRAARKVGRLFDPAQDLRRQRLEYERNPSVGTATRLAEALISEGKADEAIKLCEQARSGVFENDPTLLSTLVSAYFALGDYTHTIEAFEQLRAKNPDFHGPDGHLLYARALEGAGENARALAEYAAVSQHYPGAEARVRHAQLEKKLGHDDAAREMFTRILDDARLAPGHFRRAQREWIAIAKREIS
jgi:hypothetical protein